MSDLTLDLPDQVVKQREAALQSLAGITGEPAEDEPSAPATQSPEPVAPDVAPDTEEDAQADDEPEKSDEPESDEPEQTEAAPEPAKPTTADTNDRLTQIEQELKTTRTKYGVEIAKLNRAVETRNARIRELEERRESPPATEPDATDELSDEEKELGIETAVQKIARKVLREHAKAAESRKAQDETQHESAERGRMFFEAIENAVPDWKTINGTPDQGNKDGDPAWSQWLSQVDPVTGALRGRILRQAQDGHDAATVIELFQEFKAGTEAPKVASRAAATPPKPSIPSQATARTTPTGNTPSAKKTYTMARYEDLKLQIALSLGGDGPMSVTDARALNKELGAALTEGRIRV